jgi:hypothetical protein
MNKYSYSKIINVFFLLFVGIFYSCNQNDKIITSEKIITDVYITDVFKAKYSKIQGYIYYNNIKLEIDNGNSGYYYKNYSIKAGQKIKRSVIVYQRYYFTTDPYKNDIILSTSDIDFSDFVIQ